MGRLWETGTPYLTGLYANNYHLWERPVRGGEGLLGEKAVGMGVPGLLRTRELLGAQLA